METEQTRSTEELNQLQLLVQSLKHSMNGDYVKQESEMLIRKEVATLKKNLLKTVKSKLKKF